MDEDDRYVAAVMRNTSAEGRAYFQRVADMNKMSVRQTILRAREKRGLCYIGHARGRGTTQRIVLLELRARHQHLHQLRSKPVAENVFCVAGQVMLAETVLCTETPA